LIGLLQVLVSTAHLLVIDLALAAPFVCLGLEWWGTRHGEALAHQVGRRLARDAVVALVLGSLLGGATLGLLWWTHGERYGESLARIPTSRYWYAGAEWLFSLACLTAYAALWERMAARRWLHRLLGFFGATNLAYHFPVLFSIVSVVTSSGGAEAAPVNFRAMILAPEVMAHVTHDILAAFIVTGVYIMGLSLAMRRRVGGEPDAERVGSWGARIALPAALAQFPVGLWLWTTLPAPSSAALLMGDGLATLSFGVAIISTIGLLHHLATATLGDASRRQTLAAMALVALVLLSMVTARYRARLPLQARQAAQATGDSSHATPSRDIVLA